MKIIISILAIIGGLFLAVVGLFAFMWIRSIRKTMKRDDELDQKIKPIADAISNHSPVDEILLSELAADPLTRAQLLSTLIELERADLFPEAHRSQESIAVSDLVRWLYHPNELGSVPSDIEKIFEQEVVEEQRTGRCYLFRFRVDQNHWAGERGWMCGLAGPFWDDDPTQCHGASTFSEMLPYQDQTHEDHVAFLARASTRFGWVMPTPLQG